MTVDGSYVVAGSRPWNRPVFDGLLAPLTGRWRFVADPTELEAAVREEAPRYVFFLHWSWRVPAQLYENVECVVFHMTDVPYGRGGSPLQHLILAGHEGTVVSAIRMVEDFDAGPVYLKRDMPLHGTAEEIYARSSRVAAGMIEQIVSTGIEPVDQRGEVTVFRRRTPDQSALPSAGSLTDAYDFIRMLDATGYPSAFVDHGAFRIELRGASLYSDRLEARVIIRRRGDEGASS